MTSPSRYRHHERQRQGDREGQLHVEDGGPRHVGAEQHELAGAEVDDRRGLVDQNEAERHQRVDGAHGDTGDDQLQ